jgi:hypothetical protein
VELGKLGGLVAEELAGSWGGSEQPKASPITAMAATSQQRLTSQA